MSPILLIVILIFVLMIIGFTIFLAQIVSLSVASKIPEYVSAEKIVKQEVLASHLGLASKGKLQVRGGSGALVLTKEELWFIPAMGQPTTIPRDSITEISTPKSHLGKTLFRPLLKVSFANDSIAFSVKDVESWREALQK